MDNGFKPYPVYKKTELLWLESVPEHWDIKPNKALWTERITVNFIDKTLLSVTIKRGVIQQSELLKSSSKKDSSNLDKSKYKLVEPNDIVYNKMRMWQGAVGASKYEGIVSPAYIVLKPISNINHRFYHYLLRTPNYIEESHRNSYGICDDQLSLRYEEFKCMQSIIPPKEEQNQIVRYLDSKLAKINKYIKNKKKLIELLKEQKQAMINQAVTKGLDPKAKMKPSGIEWLGDIPEGWEVTQVGKIYDIELGKMLQPNKEDASDTLEKYLCALNVFWDRIDFNNVKKMWFSEKDKVKYKIEIGDLIVVEGGDVAVSCIWNGAVEPCYIQNAVHRVREKGYGKNKFLYYWLKSLKDIGYIDLICNKATFAHFTKEKFTRLFIFLPPLAEQQLIVAYIESKTQAIDKAVEIIKKEIDLITEYRTSLISAVVTGKVDVRNIEVEDSWEEIEEVVGDPALETLEEEEISMGKEG